MNVRLSVGKYTSNPYCLGGLEQRVYCVEELCYALKENAFLLDQDLMTDQLVYWLRSECGLEELAAQLHDQIHKKGSLSAFVRCILDYVGFFEKDVVNRVEQTLKKGAGFNVLQKRKMRIDQLCTQKKYAAAIREYDALLLSWEEAQAGDKLIANILHNKATALCGLMLYSEAAAVYLEAYQKDRNEESLFCALAAKRMELTDKEYVEFISGLAGGYEISLELEQKIEQLNQAWEQEADYMRLVQRKQLLEEEEGSYLTETDSILQALKEGYRGMIQVHT